MANEVATAGDKQPVQGDDNTASDAKAKLTAEANLASPKPVSSAQSCQGHEGMCHPGKGDNAVISNDQIINFSPPEKLVHDTAGIKIKEEDPGKLEANAIKNTKDLFLNPATSQEDRVRAAQALVRNGINEVQGTDGKTYQLNSVKEGEREQISVTTLKAGEAPSVELKGALNAQGEVLEVGGAEQPKKSETEAPPVKPQEEIPPYSGKAIFNPALSNEEKLLEADRMFKSGEKRFLGPDGKAYETSETQVGDRKVISIFTKDENGAARPLLRGIIDKSGAMANQQDDRFKAVDYESDYAKKHGNETALLNREAELKRRQEAEKRRQEEEAEKQKQEAQRKEQEEAAKLKQQEEEAERKRKEEEERNKKPATAEEQLLKTADEKFKSETDKSEFKNDMEDFQNRARARNLPQQEIDKTYGQVNRLLQEGSAAVPEEHRQLAAKTLMHQLAVPNITDQGYHNTCNVTTLAERTLTRQPAMAAEIVATSAIKGSWTARDGKEIKFKAQDLVPGSEEKFQHRTSDGSRTYATQLLNLAMVNDSLQRKMPPQYYGYGSPSATNKTGETVTYADGSPVGDGGYHGMSLSEISAIGKRLTGETDYIIESNEFAPRLNLGNNDGLIPVATKEELGETLKRMKAENRLPAIVMVDSNDKLFEGSGLAVNQDKWHVVSVTDFDESNQQAAISNQWGPSFDIKADIKDLYRSTRDNL
ncbi:MAG TPA: hypothetical protein PLY72_20175 [Candidatus Obscuribacter sp.]|nr:hypothetical protein [Candidatus Obscuribacter sp.]